MVKKKCVDGAQNNWDKDGHQCSLVRDTWTQDRILVGPNPLLTLLHISFGFITSHNTRKKKNWVFENFVKKFGAYGFVV